MFAKVLKVRYLAVLALVLIMAASAYAFAAANIVPESGAGDGNNTISGYTATNVKYTLDTDPSKLSSVAFDLASTSTNAAAPLTVKVTLVSGSTTWYSCTHGTGNNWSCSIGGAVTTLAANNLRVVAAQ